MFLVDSAEATSDWEGITKLIKTILKRAKAEIVSVRKWDDRTLAYPVQGKSRGAYILCYFRAPSGKIADIEREVRLSERVMRVLILNAENMTQEDIEKDTPSEETEKRAEKFAADAAAKTKAKKAKAAEAAEAAKKKETEDLEAAKAEEKDAAEENKELGDLAAKAEEKDVAEEDKELEDEALSSFVLGLDEIEESSKEAGDIDSGEKGKIEKDKEDFDRDEV
jgi:small subunit ribosomal protein S6